MKRDALTSQQLAQAESVAADFIRHLHRVHVSMEVASARLFAREAEVEEWINDRELEISLTLDVSSILETLRGLPDDAGTEAFIAAYNASR